MKANVKLKKEKNVTALTKTEMELFKKFQAEQKRQDDINEIKELKFEIVLERDRLIKLAKEVDKKDLVPELKSLKTNVSVWKLRFIKGRLWKLGVGLGALKNVTSSKDLLRLHQA